MVRLRVSRTEDQHNWFRKINRLEIVKKFYEVFVSEGSLKLIYSQGDFLTLQSIRENLKAKSVIPI